MEEEDAIEFVEGGGERDGMRRRWLAGNRGRPAGSAIEAGKRPGVESVDVAEGMWL